MTLRVRALLAVATLALAGCFGSDPVADQQRDNLHGDQQAESTTITECRARAVYAEKKLDDWRQYAEALEGVCGIHTEDRPDD